MAKARMAKLKVFRTAIGFHDALVAAPSRKAALEAWGADSNIFAQGLAEEVDDPALAKQALERPGEVVRMARGSAAEHVKALGKTRKREESGSRLEAGMTKADRPTPQGRKPSRAAVDKAEKALAAADAKHAAALKRLRDEERAIEERRRKLTDEQRGERARLAEAVDAALARYREKLAEWAG